MMSDEFLNKGKETRSFKDVFPCPYSKTRCLSTEEVKTHELIELVDELKQELQVSIKLVLKAVHIPRSTYYYAKEHRGRDLDDSQIIQTIGEIRQQDPKYTCKYGYR